MTSQDVTPEQAATLAQWMVPTLLRLARLKQRLEARGFPKHDPLYARTVAAYDAVRALRLEVHQREHVEGRSTRSTAEQRHEDQTPQWIRAMRAEDRSEY